MTKAYQMSVGHIKEGRFHEDGSPSPVSVHTVNSVYKLFNSSTLKITQYLLNKSMFGFISQEYKSHHLKQFSYFRCLCRSLDTLHSCCDSNMSQDG